MYEVLGVMQDLQYQLYHVLGFRIGPLSLGAFFFAFSVSRLTLDI